jgi:8-amino-7-oxononanoate synthase
MGRRSPRRTPRQRALSASQNGPLRHLDAELGGLAERGLLREPPATGGSTAELLDLCSNDYLGYAAEPWPGPSGRSGAGASRLVSGNHRAHEETEAVLAAWLGAEAALLFSSGYAANVGVLTALAQPGDVIVSDALNHASIIDGCRLSGATVRVTPHRDAGAVGAALADAAGARRRWVVTESYFSMDGDSPDLASLRSLCDQYDAALLVDEAHALGVLGPRGSGLCAAAGIQPDVLIGTAGKALGLHGAFVVGSRSLRLWLWNRARSFVFSTGVSPALAAAIGDRARRAIEDDAARARLDGNAMRLREGLARLGVQGPLQGSGPVIPWIVGPPEEALRLSRRLREHGVLVQAIRPPTVPAGTSRLRVTATASLSAAEIDLALRAFRAVVAP